MAPLNVIRRWALRDQLSIREIARRTGLARNTVKKYLRSDQTESQYAKRASSSKLDPYAEKLATWIDVEVTRSRKQRRTLPQIHSAEGFQPLAQAQIGLVALGHNKSSHEFGERQLGCRLGGHGLDGCAKIDAFSSILVHIGSPLITAVTETKNRRKRAPTSLIPNAIWKIWWVMQGLNLRPLPCEGSALPLS